MSTSAKGDDFVLIGYTEVGKRSTAEDYEEEGTDDDYAYQNYHLKLEQEVSDRLSYDISSFIYKKDYKSRDSLDNISRLFKTNWSYYLRKLKPAGSGWASDSPSHKEDFLKLDFKLRYKEKRYKNTPGSEYDQINAAPTLTFKKKDLYAVDLTAGIDNYDYLALGQKDQLKIFSSLGGDRYFLGKKLMLTSAYKIETLEQKITNRKRTKQEVMGGFDYLFDLPWLYKPAGSGLASDSQSHKITTRAGWGQRDTKEDEERDEDFDYEYWSYYTKTEHRINPKLKTDLKYQYFKKDYVGSDLDHRGFYIQNGWDYEILDDEKQRWGLEFNIEHKDVDYTLKTGNNYKKETAELKANYQRKKNWKTSVSLEENFYDFDDSSNDKKRTYVKLSGEKLFFEGDLVLSLDLKYRYTDYEQKEDKEQEAVRIAFKYRF
ncbi:MAG: hypothetical protein Q8R31_04540 [Candidatus Omnitrophota bacterium]|nr:hypothetical protein [Candidatus Omnitrophota bacterium]